MHSWHLSLHLKFYFKFCNLETFRWCRQLPCIWREDGGTALSWGFECNNSWHSWWSPIHLHLCRCCKAQRAFKGKIFKFIFCHKRLKLSKSDTAYYLYPRDPASEQHFWSWEEIRSMWPFRQQKLPISGDFSTIFSSNKRFHASDLPFPIIYCAVLELNTKLTQIYTTDS